MSDAPCQPFMVDDIIGLDYISPHVHPLGIDEMDENEDLSPTFPIPESQNEVSAVKQGKQGESNTATLISAETPLFGLFGEAATVSSTVVSNADFDVMSSQNSQSLVLSLK